MTLVIGLVGEKGSGKQTFTDYLIQIASSHVIPVHTGIQLNTSRSELDPGRSLPRTTLRNQDDKQKPIIKQIRFSDILAETLNLWALPTTRANLQKMAIVMNEGFGLGTLTHAVYNRISKETADIVILDGVRWETDAQLIRQFPKNLLMYITADVQVRYERLKNKSEKVDEQGISLEQFMEEEKAKTEVMIPKIGQGADIKIENNGSLDELKQKIKEFYSSIIS